MPGFLFESRINEIAVAFHFDRLGRIGYLDEAMSVYVQHAAGVWTGASQAEQLSSSIESRKQAMRAADPRHHPALRQIIAEREAQLAALGHGAAALAGGAAR